MCDIEKDISDFHKRKDCNDGLRKQCKKCHNLIKRQYKVDHKEDLSLKNKLWRLNNLKDPNHKVIENNRSRLYVDINRDKINAKYRTEPFKKKRRAYIKKKMSMDSAYKLKKTLRARFNLAIIREYKSGSAIHLLGCTIDFFKQYIADQFTSGMCWENHGKWHLDHIRPCGSFDLTKADQQAICFHHTNIQPLWAKDNLVKGCKV
jgi:hypothetical protein